METTKNLRIEVVGYPRVDRLVPLLEDADVIAHGHGQPPAPILANTEEVFRGLHANQLVQLDAYVRSSMSPV